MNKWHFLEVFKKLNNTELGYKVKEDQSLLIPANYSVWINYLTNYIKNKSYVVGKFYLKFSVCIQPHSEYIYSFFKDNMSMNVSTEIKFSVTVTSMPGVFPRNTSFYKSFLIQTCSSLWAIHFGYHWPITCLYFLVSTLD